MLLIYLNIYAIQIVRDRTADSSRNLLAQYMRQMDESLGSAERYMIALISNNNHLLQLGFSQTGDNSYNMAKIALSSKLMEDIIIQQSIDAYFVYSIPRNDYFDVYNERGQPRTTYPQKEQIRGFIREFIHFEVKEYKLRPNEWFVQKVGDRFYLFRIIQSGGLYVGAWTEVDGLWSTIDAIGHDHQGLTVFLTQHGEPMNRFAELGSDKIKLDRQVQNIMLSGNRSKHLVVGEHSQSGNYALAMLIPDDKLLADLPGILQFVIGISLLALLLLPAGLVVLRNTVFVPLNTVLMGMKRIRQGYLQTRIEMKRAPDELQLFVQTFNLMMDEIQTLRIHVYEERLEKQRVELERLQLQINPHFFINCLNMVHSLAYLRNVEQIQKLTMSLVRYFRSSFRSNDTFIALGDELRHIDHFLVIQQFRYQDRIHYTTDIDESVKDANLPPMLIHTFVENAVKHAFNHERGLSLHLIIRQSELDSVSGLEITIQDDGSGYPGHILEGIREGRRIVDAEGDHIGIWNVKERIRLLYGEQAAITFENLNPSGACIRIRIPFIPTEREC
ncbi:sensor histidine kinase [Paenibacillus sp. PL2-23]|uniref:sensor histidine kinase n=1 Tax=Paenibacillus sp. PL2-23 TaxID=2100729 RepID=UPI0030F6B444